MTEANKQTAPAGKPRRKQHPVIIGGIIAVVLGIALYFMFSSYPLRNMITIVDRNQDIVWFRSLNVKIDTNLAQYCIDIKDYKKAGILGVDLIRQKPDSVKGYLKLADALYLSTGNVELPLKLLKLGDVGLPLAEAADRVQYYSLKGALLTEQQRYLGTDNSRAVQEACEKALEGLKGENFGMGSKEQFVAIQEQLFEASLDAKQNDRAAAALEAIRKEAPELAALPVLEAELALSQGKADAVKGLAGVRYGTDADAEARMQRGEYLTAAAAAAELLKAGKNPEAEAAVKALLKKDPKMLNDRYLAPLILQTAMDTAEFKARLKAEYDAKTKQTLVRSMAPESVKMLEEMNAEMRKAMESGQR